jgi:hypothetical protein
MNKLFIKLIFTTSVLLNLAFANDTTKIKKNLEFHLDKHSQSSEYYESFLELYELDDYSSLDIWLDIGSSLMWQNDGKDSYKNWKEAKEYCANLSLRGFNDWRLPTIDELKIIEIPLGTSSFYWSSTTYVRNSTFARGIYSSGSTDRYPKSGHANVRCVRSGQ